MNLISARSLNSFSKKELGHYLAGLIEGDGSFMKYQLQIIYPSKDKKAAQELAKVLGFGVVWIPPKGNFVGFIVRTKEGLAYVLELTNGKFVGPHKINQLLKPNFETRLQMTILPSTLQVTLDNAWLLGFFEADGSANIKVRNSPKCFTGKSVEVCIQIAQKDPLLLNLIAPLFGQKVTQVNRKATSTRIAYKGHEIATTSQKIISLWLSYFNSPNFSLQGRKYFQICLVHQCFEFLKEKKHLTEKGLKQVLTLQKELREIELI